MAEPNRVHQTVMGAYGNCQSACLAMVLGVPLSEIPNFAQLAQDIGDNEAYQAQAEWLRERGWGLLTVVKWQSLPWPPRHGYFIAGGVSPRGNRHAVIYKDGELWHDPHPEGGGIASVDDIDFLYPLRPFAVSETRPTLPKAPGVGRDGPHAPKGTVMVFFERDLTDDELRNFHDWINGRYPSAPDALLDSDAPRGNRTRERT